MISNELLAYLSDFLIGEVYERSCSLSSEEDEERDRVVRCQRKRPYQLIAYTDKLEEMAQAAVVIRPSGFFSVESYGRAESCPSLPLDQWQGIPLLFGEPRHEWINEGKTLLIHADLIASSYFLLSRYEEMYQRQLRDEDGCFPSSESIAVKAGFADRPLVDEYGEALRDLIKESGLLGRLGLELEERPRFFSRVNLTHDIVQPYKYHGFAGFVRGLTKGYNPLRALRLSLGSPQDDPYYTFPKLLEWAKALQRNTPESLVQIRYFLKVRGEHRRDAPSYKLGSRAMRLLLMQAERAGVQYHLLCSYEAGANPRKLERERTTLERLLEREQYITSSRHHLLALREPEDMLDLLGAGILHDYSMGYRDRAGFRLGTSRPVRFINPNTRRLTDLTLHPLVLSDTSLSEIASPGRSYEETLAYALRLVDKAAHFGGELNLLWHNELFSPEAKPWHTKLYRAILRHIQELEADDSRGLSDEDKALSLLIRHHGCTEINLGK